MGFRIIVLKENWLYSLPVSNNYRDKRKEINYNIGIHIRDMMLVVFAGSY